MGWGRKDKMKKNPIQPHFSEKEILNKPSLVLRNGRTDFLWLAI
jgi:hypothetical protein